MGQHHSGGNLPGTDWQRSKNPKQQVPPRAIEWLRQFNRLVGMTMFLDQDDSTVTQSF